MNTNYLKHLFAVLILLLSHTARAQYIAATFNDASAGHADTPMVVNCDAAEFAIGSDIYNVNAMVWDNKPAGSAKYTKVFVNFRGFTKGGNVSVMDSIPNGASKPDVAIGHDLSGDFYLNVIYELNSVIVLNHYEIRFTYGITGNATAVGLAANLSNPLVVSDPTVGSTNPHIDAFVDVLSGLGTDGCYAVPKYVVSWQQLLGSTYDLKGAYSTFAAFPSALTPISFLSLSAKEVDNSDVSAYTDALGVQYANFIYTVLPLSNGVMLVESGDITSGTTATPVTLEPATGTSPVLGGPRIESQGFDPVGNGAAAWMAVATRRNTSVSNREIWSYDADHIGKQVNISARWAPRDNQCAAISAGIGEPITTGPLATGLFAWDEHNGVIFYGQGYAKIQFAKLESSGGPLAMLDTQYGANKTNQPPPYTGFPMAASSCSNSGRHQLVAWGRNTEVYYKLVYDSTLSFHLREETTSINGLPDVAGVAIYPNPTNGDIRVTGINTATYIIIDPLGKSMAWGELNRGQIIHTSWLTPGNYFLKIKEGENEQTIKFIKQ